MSSPAVLRRVEKPRTRIERFMRLRGRILTRETKYLGVMSGCDGVQIEVLATEVRSDRRNPAADAAAYGLVVLMYGGPDGMGHSCLDFDETEEFCAAIQSMWEEARGPEGEIKRHLSMTYTTRDGLTFGFLWGPQNQPVFSIREERGGYTGYLAEESVLLLVRLLRRARLYLISRGAA